MMISEIQENCRYQSKENLINEVVMVAKHDELDTVPSLQMIKALKGCGFVREPGVIYCWSLTSDREGSQYLPPEMSQPPSRDRDWIPERPH